MIKNASDVWMEDEIELELSHLINKEMREGLTPKEDKRKALLVRIVKSGK